MNQSKNLIQILDKYFEGNVSDKIKEEKYREPIRFNID
jgi:hypothetical protein